MTEYEIRIWLSKEVLGRVVLFCLIGGLGVLRERLHQIAEDDDER